MEAMVETKEHQKQRKQDIKALKKEIKKSQKQYKYSKKTQFMDGGYGAWHYVQDYPKIKAGYELDMKKLNEGMTLAEINEEKRQIAEREKKIREEKNQQRIEEEKNKYASVENVQTQTSQKQMVMPETKVNRVRENDERTM